MEGSRIKRVCHITSVHQRYDVRIFKKECITLAKSGLDVTLIVNDDLGNEILNDVKIISTNFKPKNRINRMLKSNRKIVELARKVDADIYHLHDPELLLVGNKLKKMGKKVVFDSHENYPLQIKEKQYIPKILRNIIAKIYSIYETYTVKRIEAVISPCTFNLKNPFENRARKTVFLDNLPILNEFYDKYIDTEVKQEKTICYVGSLTEDRGITHLIKAAYKAKVKLVLGGTFLPESYFDMVKNMEEFSNVDYRGYVNRDEVLDIYKKSTIGMCTILNVGQYNIEDNLSTKVYEYMSIGLPVIISDYSFAREVLKTYQFGITVDPENIEEIANAILYLVNNPEVAKEMGRNGRLAIKEKFNWSIEEKKLIALYEGL